MGLSIATITVWVLGIRNWMLSVLSVILLVLGVFWTSALAYGSFHLSYVPKDQSLAETANFIFEPCLVANGRCSHLFANVSLMDDTNQSKLRIGQRYTVLLKLELPSNERNRNVGMFLVCLTFLHKQENDLLPPISTVCRSALVPQKPVVCEAVEAIILTPFYIFGVLDTSESVTIEFFSHFLDDHRGRASLAQLEIKSRDVDIFRATFVMHANFIGLRRVMYEHYVLSSFFGIGSIGTVIFTALLIFWKKFFSPLAPVPVDPLSIRERQARAREALKASPSQQKVISRVYRSLQAGSANETVIDRNGSDEESNGVDDHSWNEMRIDASGLVRRRASSVNNDLRDLKAASQDLPEMLAR